MHLLTIYIITRGIYFVKKKNLTFFKNQTFLTPFIYLYIKNINKKIEENVNNPAVSIKTSVKEAFLPLVNASATNSVKNGKPYQK